MRGIFLRLLLPFLLFAASVPAAAGSEHVPEPQGYWQGPIHGPVPATITGGTVLDTAVLAQMLAGGGVVLLDVAEATHRPSGLPGGTLWLPPPHRDIPGSVWIPDVGRGVISPDFAAWFRARLAALTGSDRDRRIVVYCHPNCWMSWNAARRVINDGYRAVFWYPGGVEGWEHAGHPTAVANPEQPATH
ncbi:MAG TPA: rhodanese-like domain-containing protein [Acetobacteraceae bacterium]|jgi:PQQ-dependent catabolism-associated CXXCW motif protein|nr:rhodanese-like domain-containing protein [Acetobacteraceae bacterium]